MTYSHNNDRDTYMNIYFSDWFSVDPEVLDEYGAFNISLINDLPLFIDPFLLFTSDKRTYRAQHDRMIDYLKFLRDQSASGNVTPGLLRAWYRFPEIKQLWLGFSLKGNKGSGLGWNFAKSLNSNLNSIFSDFGNERVARGSHLEKVCLVHEGVGRDNISDFTANLIKEFLLKYTQRFAVKHIDQTLRRLVRVPSVEFDYDAQMWKPKVFDLPYIFDDYVLLCPKDILTKDANWINRGDMIDHLDRIVQAVPDQQLRALINRHLIRNLNPDASEMEKRKVHSDLCLKFPTLVERYIRSKENRGDEAIRLSQGKVAESEYIYIQQIIELAAKLKAETEFYEYGIDTLAEAQIRVQYLKDVIENNDGYRIFYRNGKACPREADVKIMFRLIWYATPSDFNTEVNNGRGPVDCKASRGSKDSTLVEFKLAKNTHLEKNLANQVKVYKKANRTSKSLKVIVYCSVKEKKRVDDILERLKLVDDDSIILIDARDDNKPSASVA